jgi:peptidoglycan hydrolase-like protein with peptidoglycan-binding domain
MISSGRATRLMLLPFLAAGLGLSPCFLRADTSSTAAAAAKKKTTNTARNGSSKSKTVSTGGKSSKRGRKEVGQKAPTPERVSEIQQALAKDGSYSRTPNGQWDGSTVDAMKKFQGMHGLNPSGRLDAKTLEQLGLGSKTAGIGAPTVTKASLLGMQRDGPKTALRDQ